MYRYIYKLQNRRHVYRKLYSFYRVTSALLESVTVIVVVVLLMFTGTSETRTELLAAEGDVEENNYKRNTIIDLIEQRMATFFGVNTRVGNYDHRDIYLIRDVVLSFSLFSSFLIILTALVQYWYQAKNVSMTWMGRLVLGMYLGLLIVNKLTTTISLLSTSKILSIREPRMALSLSMVFIGLLVSLRFGLVYIYKRRFSRSWAAGDNMDRWMNVIVNTFVVIPFTVYRCPVLELKASQARFSCDENLNLAPRRRSDAGTRREEILRALGGAEVEEESPILGLEGARVPGQEQLRELILQLWWANPSRKLTTEQVKQKMLRRHHPGLVTKELEANIRELLLSLEAVGLVNTPLLAPAPTRHEYFALLLLVIAENVVSVAVEAGAGGRATSTSTYYSWDIRLCCMVLALVFLLAYYCKSVKYKQYYHDMQLQMLMSRYHMTVDLCDKSLASWCRCGATLAADPPSEDVMQSILSQETER